MMLLGFNRINSASASKSQQAKYAAEINEIRQKHMEQLQTTRDTAAAKEEALREELDLTKTKMAAEATEARETVRGGFNCILPTLPSPLQYSFYCHC